MDKVERLKAIIAQQGDTKTAPRATRKTGKIQAHLLERHDEGLLISAHVQGLTLVKGFQRSERPNNSLSRHNQWNRAAILVHFVQGPVKTLAIVVQIHCDDVGTSPRITKNVVRPNAGGIGIQRHFCSKKGCLLWIINMLDPINGLWIIGGVVSQDGDYFGIIILIGRGRVASSATAALDCRN